MSDLDTIDGYFHEQTLQSISDMERRSVSKKNLKQVPQSNFEFLDDRYEKLEQIFKELRADCTFNEKDTLRSRCSEHGIRDNSNIEDGRRKEAMDDVSETELKVTDRKSDRFKQYTKRKLEYEDSQRSIGVDLRHNNAELKQIKLDQEEILSLPSRYEHERLKLKRLSMEEDRKHR